MYKMNQNLFFIGKINKKIEEIAKEKGYNTVYFIKEIFSVDNKSFEDSKEYNSCIINIENLENLRKAIDKSQSRFKFIFVLGSDNAINRVALENRKVSGLISPEFNRKFDYVHYKNSGLNQVLAKIAKSEGKMLIEDLSFLKSEFSKKIKSQILGRIMQNYALSRKYKFNFILTFIAENAKEIMKTKDIQEFYDGLMIDIK